MTAGAVAVVARREERAAAAAPRQQAAPRAALELPAGREEQQQEQQQVQSAARRSAKAPAGDARGLATGAAAKAKTLQDKKVWRRSASINALLPKGAAGFANFPRREEARFGEAGDEGDALFEAAMAAFKADEFGDQHCQLRVIKQKIGQVGLFGEWLQRHKFGTYIDWVEDATGAYVTVAVERDGKLRIPSAAALNQYVLVQVRARVVW